MTCHTVAPTKPPADIVTYRYNKQLAYVPVTPNYNQALSHAREAFPQLKHLRDASLSLSLTAPDHEHRFVGIIAPAWPMLVAHLSRYQIVDVQIMPDGVPTIPEITITYADADVDESEPAPPYQSTGPDVVDDEKAAYARQRSPSPTLSAPTLHPKRSWFFQKRHGQ